MPSVYCGDPVSEKIGFSGFNAAKGDRQALVILTRDPDEVVKNFALDVKNEEVEVKWPDLEKGDDYWGGAKAYLDGAGSWRDRWDRQVYFFQVIVGNYFKKSDTIMVDPLPAKGPETKSPTMPVIIYNRNIGQVLDLFGVSKVPKLLNPKPYTHPNCTMGRFDIEFKNGEVLLTVAVELTRKSNWVPANIFDRFKRRVEGFWNGPNGFGGFALHRKACVREKKCDCKIAYDRQANVVSGGCCKIPVRLEIENSGRHGMTFEVYYRGFLTSYFSGAWAPDPGGQPGKINYPEGGTNTWAHEIGHCLGFPDQYLGGHFWDNAPQGKFPKKLKSIMGGRQSKADEDHLHYVEEFMGSDFTIIRETINR